MPLTQPNGPHGNQDRTGSAPNARLLTAMKQQRRHSRAVQQAMASLRELQLGP